MGFLATILNTPTRLTDFVRGSGIHVSQKLINSARADNTSLLEQLNTSYQGITQDEAEERLEQYGPNDVAREKRTSAAMRLIDNVKNPLVILLVVLGLVSYLTGDMRATVVIFVMVLLGIVLRYVQESRADSAAEKLKAMVSTTATVLRDGAHKEISLKELVPGDIVLLSAGDMVPADLRLLSAKDLFLNQGSFNRKVPSRRKITHSCLP